MKLLLRRNQKSGLFGGKVTFILDARADLTPAEKAYVQKYKMGRTILYKNYELIHPGSGLLGMLSRWWFRMTNIHVTVNDLVKGKHIEVKNILEMITAEERLKEACQILKDILLTAAQFGGEEVVQI